MSVYENGFRIICQQNEPINGMVQSLKNNQRN